jgi:membrane fusion protein
LQQKQDEVLDQQARLQTAQRSKMSLDRDLNNAQTELDTLAGKSKREQTQLKRQSLELEQASVSTQTKHQFVIIAPQAGIVTAIQVDPGQMVTNQTLLTILPAHAQLEAQLYVPSRAAGFIKVGQQVQIRYAAYPYQKFGQYQGKVQEVSRTALSAAELPAQLGTATTSGNSEGMYRVRVLLGQQAITAYGKPQKLNAGMQLEADILQDRRTLIEWVLEPIYSLFGKVV